VRIYPDADVRPLTRPGLALAALATLLVVPTMASGALSRASAPAANSATFQDDTGENEAAPDITTVAISNDDTRMLTFRITIPNRQQFTQDMELDVFVDSDNRADTGDAEFVPGADYVIQYFRGEAALFKWDGTDFTRSFGNPPAVTLSTSYAGGVATIRIAASELGNTKVFRSLLFAISGIAVDPVTGADDYTNVQIDTAPNYGIGLYPFEVKVTPATLVVRRFKAAPARPAAGKPFTLRLVAARSDSGAVVQNGRVKCVGRAGNVRLRARVARVMAGAATCTWNIPPKAKGKPFRGSVAVVFEGLKASQAYAGRIR
jgi:hypothetical protein